MSSVCGDGPDLSVRGVGGRSDHLVEVRPVDDLPVRDAPQPHLGVQRPADEVPVVHRVELDASHCIGMSESSAG